MAKKQPVFLFNTLTRRTEEFAPLRPGEVGMYSCGPTVYYSAHLGHARAYVTTDSLRRMLEYNGLVVKQVMNITDVGHLTGDRNMGEDKLEVGARRENKTAWEIARFYEDEFWGMFEELNIEKPTVVCRATEHIELMIEMVKELEAKGLTYRTSDGIYFDTSKYPDYNGLSKMPLEELTEGARVEVNEERKNPTDFVLWKFTAPGVERQMEWPSPWAEKSFPGWHIECSAMSQHYLGKEFDLHTGGVDHIAVHHTNERTQNWGITGGEVVKHWLHNEFLLVEGQKMSKSLGNFYTLAQIKEKGFEPLALRYLFLMSHYRKQMNFTWKGLAAAQEGLKSLRAEILRLKAEGGEPGRVSEEWRESFLAVINDDLAMPAAVALVGEVMKSDLPAAERLATVFDFDRVLGLRLAEVEEPAITEEIKKLAEDRQKKREQRDWVAADELRGKIEEKGWEIEDQGEGFRLMKKS